MMNQGEVTGSGRHDLDIWHVRLANGETRALSLDALSEAFNEGWVDERTPVLRAGALRWAPLGEVAGLDEPAPPSAMPNSIAPLAMDACGTSIPFDIDVSMDAESDADVQAFRPRRGKKILGVMTALVVVAGLGFAAMRGRPLLDRALASSGLASKVTPAAAELAATQPAPAQPAQAQPAQAQPAAAQPAAAEPAQAQPAEAKAPAQAAADAPEKATPSVAAGAIPTLTAAALPNAALTPAEKKAAKVLERKAAAEARRAKRAPRKRGH